VGVDVGYCDNLQSTFLAAYDASGRLLDFKYNNRFGFQFLSIERPTADICRVMVGDCNGPLCYPDGGGSGMNCLSYSNPVATTQPLPSDAPPPPPPIIQGTPGLGRWGVVVMTIGMAGMAFAAFQRWANQPGV
jgi:hypothetical protein